MKLIRSAKNPILTPTGNSWENKYVYNCAAFEMDEKIHLLYRAQGNDMVSRFGLARLSSPDVVEWRSEEPVFAPDPNSEYETKGVEDPRVTKIGDTYYIAYTAASLYPPLVPNPARPRPEEWRVRVSLARTKDFRSFVRYGVAIGHIDSKDATLFPEKINGGLLLAHRVVPQIRLAIAPNGRNYKERGPLFGPRKGMWDSHLVGTGAQPIKTQHGWLLIYHGVDDNLVYRLGLALLDIHDPSLVLARSVEPILEPVELHEKEGQIKNVVFTCGALETDDQYLVYYGAADSSIGLATIEKEKVLNWAKERSGIGQYHTFEQIGHYITEETKHRDNVIS